MTSHHSFDGLSRIPDLLKLMTSFSMVFPKFQLNFLLSEIQRFPQIHLRNVCFLPKFASVAILRAEKKRTVSNFKNRSTRVSPRPREVGDCIILYLSFQFVCAQLLRLSLLLLKLAQTNIVVHTRKTEMEMRKRRIKLK